MAPKLCSECCEDCKTVFAFVTARPIDDFYSFENINKSLVKTEKCNFFKKNLGLNHKSLSTKKFSTVYFTYKCQAS